MIRLAFIALLLLLCAFGPVGNTLARREAAQFILEKLRREQGPGWERAGQYFYWSYAISRDGCELDITRRDGFGSRYAETIPLAQTVPVWLGQGTLRLACRYDAQCIDFRQSGPDIQRDGQIGDTRILAPDPNDLPKLLDAFNELHRLCDDPYRR
mgnify:CR=1 FL=1